MERFVFKYKDWNGADAYADPGETRRRIKEVSGGNLSKAILDMQNGDAQTSSAAVDLLKQSALHGFDLKPFDRATGEGWLEADLIGLIAQFNDYINGLKKNTATSRTA